jgi:hypothetical protein
MLIRLWRKVADNANEFAANLPTRCQRLLRYRSAQIVRYLDYAIDGRKKAEAAEAPGRTGIACGKAEVRVSSPHEQSMPLA